MTKETIETAKRKRFGRMAACAVRYVSRSDLLLLLGVHSHIGSFGGIISTLLFDGTLSLQLEPPPCCLVSEIAALPGLATEAVLSRKSSMPTRSLSSHCVPA